MQQCLNGIHSCTAIDPPASVRRVHGNYLFFYRVSADTVEILHVLHGAMDYEAVLFPEG